MQADMSSTITQVETLQSYLEQGIEAVMVKDDAIPLLFCKMYLYASIPKICCPVKSFCRTKKKLVFDFLYNTYK